jgi:hypothetical protein
MIKSTGSFILSLMFTVEGVFAGDNASVTLTYSSDDLNHLAFIVGPNEEIETYGRRGS